MENILAELKQQFINKFQLDHEEADTLLEYFQPTELKRKEYFLSEGQVSRRIGLIIKGCMYGYFNKDSDEVIDEFYTEGDFVTDYSSFLSSEPTFKNIVCSENCKILVIDKEKLVKLYSKRVAFERMGRLIAESLFVQWQNKLKSQLLDDAETRYLKFVNLRNDLHQRVPQYLIASYLNIAPQSLSRIRSNLKKK